MARASENAEGRGAPDPTSGGRLTRALRGAGYLLAGWRFVLRDHPKLLSYCLLPLALNLVLFAGLLVGLYFYHDQLIALFWAKPTSWLLRILWYLAYVFILLLVLLLSYAAFFVVQALLSSPFNDLLSERAELLAAGREPPPFSFSRFARLLGRTLLHEAAKLGVYLALMALLLLVNFFVPVLGPVVFLVGGFYVSALFFGYDYLDFCMARREWSLARKRRALREHRALTVGFGAAVAGALLVPVLGILCVPMAAVGGTLLFCDLERAGAFADICGISAPHDTGDREPPRGV